MLASLLGAAGAPAWKHGSDEDFMAYGGLQPARGIEKLDVGQHPALQLADAVLNHSTSQSETAMRVFVSTATQCAAAAAVQFRSRDTRAKDHAHARTLIYCVLHDREQFTRPFCFISPYTAK